MTAQVGDLLILGGKRAEMALSPDIPEHHPRVVEVSYEEARLDESIPGIVMSTACWRQYQATWEIKDERFYLVDVKGIYRILPGEPILADWFTGVLRIPQGKLLQYVHMGFGSVHEEERHIKIDNGIVVAERTVPGQTGDPWELTKKNLPGNENSFPGDDELKS